MNNKNRLSIVLVAGLVLGLVSGLLTASARGEELAAVEITGIYLPVSVKNTPWITSFGAQVRSFNDPGVTSLAKDGRLQWARMDAFKWGDIEPVNTNTAGFKWSAVDEASLITANENGIQVIGIIRDTPAWAQKNPPYACGAISASAMPEFVNFVKALVKRYSVEPYNVKYWEIWNEPDVEPALVGENSVFGCWGDPSDQFYGGEYYSKMLNQVYPAIKSVDSTSKVGIGGLLLDCDPADRSCHSGKFFQGVLRYGLPTSGANFDFVSFHGYTPYSASTGLSLDMNNPKWSHRGGVVLGKLDFLKDLMERYNVDKPIFHTEGALNCPELNPADCDPPGSDFYQAQADYVVWLYVRNWANDIDVTIWFLLEGPGWRYSGLLDGSQSPKPAYNAFKFLSLELATASFNGRVLLNYPDIAGYEFVDESKKVWVVWSPDEKPHTIIVPSNAIQALDKFGTVIPISGNQLTVKSPVYIEFPN